MKFRKKPVIIEATQWFKNGDHPLDHESIGIKTPNAMDLTKYSEYLETEGRVVRYFRHPEVSGECTCKHCGKNMHDHGWIDTLEGGHIVCPEDWIITGVEGEHYPCKPHIFEQTYVSATQKSIPDIKELVEALEQGFPLLSDDGLDELEHHCEWVIQRERKRVHSILAAHRKQGGDL